MAAIIQVAIKAPLRDAAGRFRSMADDGIRRICRSELQRMGKELRDELRADVPGRGGLKKYITYRTQENRRLGRQGMELRIRLETPNRPYPRELWDYIIRGTRPHEIVPRRARVLAFFWEKLNRMAFFMRVMHPGTRPNDFVTRVWARVGESELERTGRRIGRYAIAELLRR